MTYTQLSESEAELIASQLSGEAHPSSDGEWGVLIDLSGPQDWSGQVFFLSNAGDFTYESRDHFFSGVGPLSGYRAMTGERFGEG